MRQQKFDYIFKVFRCTKYATFCWTKSSSNLWCYQTGVGTLTTSPRWSSTSPAENHPRAAQRPTTRDERSHHATVF